MLDLLRDVAQVEVLWRLSSDLTRPQIAGELDVTTRAAAVRKAHEHGLI